MTQIVSSALFQTMEAIAQPVRENERLPTQPRTEFDGLPMPGGRKLASVEHLARELAALGVEGASHSNGRQANAEAYAKHIRAIYDAGGKAKVHDWLAAQAPRSEK